jgi:hypothetical protein
MGSKGRLHCVIKEPRAPPVATAGWYQCSSIVQKTRALARAHLAEGWTWLARPLRRRRIKGSPIASPEESEEGG